MSLRCSAVLLLCGSLLLSSCKAPPPEPVLSGGIDLNGMDRSVAPGDDFYAYANGGWIKATPIPSDKRSYGAGDIVVDRTRKQLESLIRDTASNPTAGEARKVADFYASFMDEAGVEARGLAPIASDLAAIDAIGDRRSLAHVLGANLRADVDPLNNTNFQTGNLFGVWISQSLNDPTTNTPYLLQGGLGMPDRDYYLSPSGPMEKMRAQYRSHIAAMFRLAGRDDPEGRAARVMELENQIARVHASRTESSDVHRAQEWKRDQLPVKAPGLDWGELLAAASLSDASSFFIWQPAALSGLSALSASAPLKSWKDWLAFHAIEQAASFLPKAFVDEHFAFYGRALDGTPELRERWQRAVDQTSGSLGELVGRLYVDRYFPPEAKARLQTMVDDLIKAFGKRIDALDWMSPQTRAKAKEKLETLRVGVGYPDHWRDYSTLSIAKDDLVGNIRRAALFDYRLQLAKLHQPVDRDEWWMTPQTVNALNLPMQNALNFPAAILQPPFFDPEADAAYNFGAMGAIIGHEISHSFDDQGSLFDASGRLANWWTAEDFSHFRQSGDALVAQYDLYKPFADLSVNGRQTLSENIADLAGLRAAHDAYVLSLAGKPAPLRESFSGDQRFFISFAQTWRAKSREEALRNQITSDGHAPDEYRADTVRNLDAWYAAFAVTPGQKMYLPPAERVKVW